MTANSRASAFTVFRNAALLACLAVAVQKLVPLWFIGQQSLPFLHFPLVRLMLPWAEFSGSGAERLLPIFRLLWGVYVCGFACFAAAFWWRTHETIQRTRRTDAALIAAQILLALLVDDKLLYLVAAELAFVLGCGPALAWLVAQMVLTIGLYLAGQLQQLGVPLSCNVSGSNLAPLSASHREMKIMLDLATSLVFQVITFCIGYLGAAEQRHRIKLAATHAELQATQQLLAEAAAGAERARIARELHDAIGHHLTALNLHLDLAVRRAGTSAAGSMLAARELARQMFTAIRGVVRAERQNQPTLPLDMP